MDLVNAINQILEFLDNEGCSGSSFWIDKDGNGFDTDMGYFYEGLERLRDYLQTYKGNRLSHIGDDDNDNNSDTGV